MKKKNYLTTILIVSVIGIVSGFYLKFIKTYMDEKLQVTTNDTTQRQPNLNETIAFLEELKNTTDSNNILSVGNDTALKRLKTINQIAIVVMSISAIFSIWSAQQLNRLH